MGTKLTVTSVALAAATAFLVAMPATAATKLFEIYQKNAPFIVTDANVCSASDDLVGRASFRLTVWDDDGDGVEDRGVGYLTINARILDSVTGDTLGTYIQADHENAFNIVPGSDTDPYMLQFNLQAECKGQVITSHIGITRDNNGGVHFHHIF